MASRMMYQDLKTLEIGLVLIPFVIDIAADGSVVSSTAGKGVTVAKGTTGLYNVTVADKYNSYVAIPLGFQAATAVDLKPQLVSANASTGAIVVRTVAVATLTDPSAVCKIHGLIIAKNSSV